MNIIKGTFSLQHLDVEFSCFSCFTVCRCGEKAPLKIMIKKREKSVPNRNQLKSVMTRL